MIDDPEMKHKVLTLPGVALIAIQSILTGALAICIAVNAIYGMCKQNPHEKKRKELQKQREAADLTPLDARNSLLSGVVYGGNDGKGQYQKTASTDQFYINEGAQGNFPMQEMRPDMYHQRNVSATSGQGLMGAAAPMAQVRTGPGPYEESRNQYPPPPPEDSYRSPYQPPPQHDPNMARGY